jgi:membrane-bound inhibitor of C-type lysozyme
MKDVESKQWLILSTMYAELLNRMIADIQCSRTEITIQFLNLRPLYRIKFDNKKNLDLMFYYSASGNRKSSNKTKLIHIQEADLANVQDLCYRLVQSWGQFNQDCLLIR